MKKTITMILTIALILTAVSALAEGDTYEIESVVVAWETTGENEKLYTALEKNGTAWEFYGEADEFSIGSCVILTVWDPETEIVDVEEIEMFTAEEVAHYLDMIP